MITILHSTGFFLRQKIDSNYQTQVCAQVDNKASLELVHFII